MIVRYFHTLKHLKAKQIFFQLYYKSRAIARKFSGYQPRFNKSAKGQQLSVIPWIPANESWQQNTFTFLNQAVTFEKINWDYALNGKLWTYNLNYFDFLNQPSTTKDEGLALMKQYIVQLPLLKNANEPYPISLRGINWIKFNTHHQIRDTQIDNSLYSQYAMLFNSIEYHLLGNHLLENALSLYIGGIYFNDEKLHKKGFTLITKELKEQILSDGAHFELSPMYHQIILSRLLDCLNFAQAQDEKKILATYALQMLGWLLSITLKNGAIPLLNDAAKNIAPRSQEIFDYAARLNLFSTTTPFGASGYRKWELGGAEMIIDVGPIGPSYIPGHAHADFFNFELYDQSPIIVDSGISTYEKNERRELERSTSSHNTVSISYKNQIDTWGGFRVGKRADVQLLKDGASEIIAEHNGYAPFMHRRSWKKTSDDEVQISDTLSLEASGELHFHFHPNINPHIENNCVHAGNWTLTFFDLKNIHLQKYLHAEEFNVLQEASKIVIEFKGSIVTTIARTKTQ